MKTCTLDTSKRLAEVCKEHGITVESEMMWANREGKDACMETKRVKSYADAGICSLEIYPALTFEEAWRLLPAHINIKGKFQSLTLIKDTQHTVVGYWLDGWFRSPEFHESPAEAATLLLIWIIENGYWEKNQ